MGGNVAKFYRALQKGNEVQALAVYVSASKEMKFYNPNQFYGKCSHGNTPMHYAAKYAMKELLEKFLYIGNVRGDPEFPNLEGKNCFHLVCSRLPRNLGSGGGSEMNLTSVNRTQEGAFKAEAKRRADCLEILLNWKANDGSPPDLFMQDSQGNTALHIAVMSGLEGCVRLLRNAGAPLFLENKDGKTACDLCEKQSSLAHIAHFLESAMVFNCQQDSQDVCVAEINGLRSEIAEYESKGLEKESETGTGLGTGSLECIQVGSKSGCAVDSAMEECWTRCSLDGSKLSRLRSKLITEVALEAKVSHEESELLLVRNCWSKELALSSHHEMVDKLSVLSGKSSSRLFSASYHSSSTSNSYSHSNSSRSHSSTAHTNPITPCSSLKTSSSYASLADPEAKTKRRRDSVISQNSIVVSAEVHHEVIPVPASSNTSQSQNKSKIAEENEDQEPMASKDYDENVCATATASISNDMFSERLQEVICEICLFPIDTGDPCNTVIQLFCLHNVCYSCWVEYVEMQVTKDRKCNIACPVYQCNELLTSLKIEKLFSSMSQFLGSSQDEIESLMKLLEENRVDAFVEACEDIKWCPEPNCKLAVQLPNFLKKRPCVNYFYSLSSKPSTPVDGLTIDEPSTSSAGKKKRSKSKREPELHVVPEDQISSVSVSCANEHYFCWNCQNEGHQPASCSHWAMWHEKVDQVKPNQMGTRDIWESAEYAANYLWFVTQSKKCPKCSAPIQKVDGCNHMKCVAKGCRHEFCWICLTSWSKHGSSTGGFWRCNRFLVQEIARSISNNQETRVAAETVESDPAVKPDVSSNTAAEQASSAHVNNGASTSRQATNDDSRSSEAPKGKRKSLTRSLSGASRNSARSFASRRTFGSGDGNLQTITNGRRNANGNQRNLNIDLDGGGQVEPKGKVADLHKFLHYYSRFYNHRLSMRLETPLLDQARQKISSLLNSFENEEKNMKVSRSDASDDASQACDDALDRQKRLTFLETAIKELILTRKVLSASYVFAYYLSQSHHQNVRALFEYIQNDLEETVENLAQIVNRQHLSAPWFLVEKAKLIVKKKRYELLDATTRGILPSDTSPIFKRKRKTFKGVQVCLDPLKMNISERQAVMASLYEMVVTGDGWLVDSTGCHNNIPMLYGQEDFYDLGVQNTRFLKSVASVKSPNRKKSSPLETNSVENYKPCARRGCNRRVALPVKALPKRRNGMLGFFPKQKLSEPLGSSNLTKINQPPRYSLDKQNVAPSFCSLSCMRRDKLDWLEDSGFTTTGQKKEDGEGSTHLCQQHPKMTLDNEFPPVFLDNERLDRKRREIVRKNYEQQHNETTGEGEAIEQGSGHDHDSQGKSSPSFFFEDSSSTSQMNSTLQTFGCDDSHLIQCCSSAA